MGPFSHDNGEHSYFHCANCPHILASAQHCCGYWRPGVLAAGYRLLQCWVCTHVFPAISLWQPLTHWGRVTHICISKLTIIGSDNGLLPGPCQAIIWTNAGILLIGPLGTNFNETSMEIHTFSLKKIHLKLSSGKWWPSCLGLNALISVSWGK